MDARLSQGSTSYPGFLLGVVKEEVVEEAFKWVQSTADSVLGCFLAHLTTPVCTEKDCEYFCPGLLTSPSSPPRSLLRGGVCNSGEKSWVRRLFTTPGARAEAAVALACLSLPQPPVLWPPDRHALCNAGPGI